MWLWLTISCGSDSHGIFPRLECHDLLYGGASGEQDISEAFELLLLARDRGWKLQPGKTSCYAFLLPRRLIRI